MYLGFEPGLQDCGRNVIHWTILADAFVKQSLGCFFKRRKFSPTNVSPQKFKFLSQTFLKANKINIRYIARERERLNSTTIVNQQ